MLKSLCLTTLIAFSLSLLSQDKKGPAARFTFNNSSEANEVTGEKIKAVGVSFCRDRFGNTNNAIFFYGNISSYINLGTYAALKPNAGTVSLWANIESDTWSGKGRQMNSLIITKNGPG